MRITKATNTSVKASDCKVFDTHGGDSELNKYSGQKVEVIRPLTSDEADLDEVGMMYKVRLPDGTIIDAFEDELDDCIESCGDIKASKKLSANDQALQHIKAAIDILGKSGNKDDVTKDSIANLGVVMFDLKSQK